MRRTSIAPSLPTGPRPDARPLAGEGAAPGWGTLLDAAPRRAATSYTLKHEAQEEIGYVTNGMFIAAAIACGFEVMQAKDGPNAWLNISNVRPTAYRPWIDQLHMPRRR